ncbi:MAG: hypothetical protein FWC47_07915 [Oscillospiraceae bacterium]|nr:hypothetical protein [Oscillospiraceae bacterium]
MNGFLNDSFNRHIAADILSHIVTKVLECIDLMREDCENNLKKLDNNEIVIRDYLYCNYLNDDTVMRSINFDNYRFISEVPENYVDNKPIGRADLQVFNIEQFRHRAQYFIIECKRIDGNLTLNRKYIDEGMRRFVGRMPKYTSYYNMNCMLGFVVKNIDVQKNVDSLNQLLQKDYTDIHVEEYLYTWRILRTYISSHGRVTLIHAFPNCVSLIEERPI